ncbi:helix-turn-helix domain-containing protein [Micromonospora sp. LOL_015]|uniref:helix-turn-helix domain-containing protein n=1 Tax=Micromonospora sp. LOL_015 TaxID=3345416 RepID=UPI003A8BCF77
MRYADSGGLSAGGRAKREQVRMQAARMFATGVPATKVAARLRVSTKSAYQWRRRWQTGGMAALASTGPGGTTCRLTPPTSCCGYAPS